MRIEMIAAVDQAGALGKDNDLIIRSKQDMKFFKHRRQNKVLVMGRKTFESIGSKPLSGATCIVITSNSLAMTVQHDDCFFVHNKEAAINLAKRINKDLLVIGGSSVYEAFVEDADIVWLTSWSKTVIDADTFLTDKTSKIIYGRHGQTIAHVHADDGTPGMIRAYTPTRTENSFTIFADVDL